MSVSRTEDRTKRCETPPGNERRHGQYPVPMSSLFPDARRFEDSLPIELTLSPFIVAMIVPEVIFWRKKTRMLIFLAGLFIMVLASVLPLTRVGGVIAADRFTYVAIQPPNSCRELCALTTLSQLRELL